MVISMPADFSEPGCSFSVRGRVAAPNDVGLSPHRLVGRLFTARRMAASWELTASCIAFWCRWARQAAIRAPRLRHAMQRKRMSAARSTQPITMNSSRPSCSIHAGGGGVRKGGGKGAGGDTGGDGGHGGKSFQLEATTLVCLPMWGNLFMNPSAATEKASWISLLWQSLKV